MAIDFDIQTSSKFKDIKIIKPTVFKEDRGFIWTSYSNKEINSLLPEDLDFIHDKFSKSNQRVLRGIHGDKKTWKLISCIYGQIMQVLVDFRQNSNTYLHHEIYNLDYESPKMILIPPGFGNAFYVKSEYAIYHYKLAYLGAYADVNDQFTIPWNDPRLSIDWPDLNPITSDRDKSL